MEAERQRITQEAQQLAAQHAQVCCSCRIQLITPACLHSLLSHPLPALPSTVWQRLAEVEQQLAAALEARAVLEADTKRAFMRGVCALNLEVSLWGPQVTPPHTRLNMESAQGYLHRAGRQVDLM